MQVETLKDILHWTKMFHEQLSQCLSHCSDVNTSERARMILVYLSDHEEKLMKVVNNFEASGDEHALNTWSYEYINKQPIVQHVHCDSPFAKLDSAQIMDVIVERHEQVIELYRYLAAQAHIPSSKELLESLLSLEEHETMLMVHAANRFEDL